MYRPHRRAILLLLLLAATFSLTGCLFHTRIIDRQLSDRPLKTATQQQLIAYVNDQAQKIQSMQATVDIDSSAGDPKNGRITDYKEIRGYVLARKPAMLRMKGLMPVVRNTAFDMVSNGQEFKVWIPPQNKFVVGSNNNDNYQPDKRLENLRPQYIYDALLLPDISADEIAVLENGYETVLDTKKHRAERCAAHGRAATRTAEPRPDSAPRLTAAGPRMPLQHRGKGVSQNSSRDTKFNGQVIKR